jgi:hypothetical protein
MVSISGGKSFSQEIEQFNINVDNGLPSNTVYGLMVDHYGYLWISTFKGVARYNGYDLKVYDLSNDFVNKEIWRTTEDKKGRVWLYSISNSLGYIYKNKYHTIYYKDSNASFYPRYQIKDYDEGVYFLNRFGLNYENSLHFIKGDTLARKIDLSKYGILAWIGDQNHLVVIDNNLKANSVSINNDNVTLEKVDQLKRDGGSEPDINFVAKMTTGNCLMFANYLIGYFNKGNYISLIDIKKLTYKNISFKDIVGISENENIGLIYERNKVLYVLTEKKIYDLDSNLNVVNVQGIDSVFERSRNEKLSLYLKDTFWGKVFATYNYGFYISCNKNIIFEKVYSFDLANFAYIGNSSDSVSFWWNNSAKTIAKVENNQKITYLNYGFSDVKKIIPFNRDSCILLTQSNILKVDIKSLGTNLYIDFSGVDGVFSDPSKYYILSKSFGLYSLNPASITINIKANFIDSDRYNAIIADTTRNLLWLFNYHKILIIDKKGGSMVFKNKQLGALGINSIDNILIDNKFGNIFLKEENRLLLLTDIYKPYIVLFGNYVFKNAIVKLYKDKLIMVGQFGILFSEILGKGHMSEPVIYPNTRELIYKVVNDFQVSNNQLLLSTDLGTYKVKIPDESVFASPEANNQQPYKFIVSYNDNLFDISRKDTIEVEQRNTKLFLDIIKPDGIGQVKYFCRIADADSNWHELNKNELNLPRVKADRYYTLSVIASDKQWRSNPIDIQLYIIPYWWEKPLAKAFLWIGGFIFVLVLVYLVVIITKKVVIKNSLKRNQHLELELKSVYSQLNPHFIFNSLGAAMYLVKINRSDDAYKHIYKFSNLLRAYIKSSRNRFILLSEEIVNLENYIDLQQARFKNKFEYKIISDPALDSNVKIPSLLVQPLVENAITHGLLPKENAGFLKIEFKSGPVPKEVICIIEDDGIGRSLSLLNKVQNTLKYESYGSQLITDLISTLNKYEKIKIRIEYLDKKEPLTGTIVKLSIKSIS